MSYFSSKAMQPLLEAIKEVNTPSASIGDLISYTITLTNLTAETLTHIVVNDIIDKSLEVEVNSIGINGTVSSKQTLSNLVIPDLLPQAQSTVEFNAYIRRAPSSANGTLKEAAQVFFDYQGNSYNVRTSEAITTVQQNLQPFSFLSAIMTADTEQAVIGQYISYCLILQPNGCYGLSNIVLTLSLDSYLEAVTGSLYVNGLPGICQANAICLPDLMGQPGKNVIVVEFKARVVSMPTTIRALTSVSGNIMYMVNPCNIALSTASNEILVEIVPARLECSYEVNVPLMQVGFDICYIEGISIKNTVMMPSCGQPSSLKFDLAYQIAINYMDMNQQSQQYILQQIHAIEYPYSEQTQLSVWMSNDEIRFLPMEMMLRVHVLIEG